jgi:hypothetical protein
VWPVAPREIDQDGLTVLNPERVIGQDGYLSQRVQLHEPRLVVDALQDLHEPALVREPQHGKEKSDLVAIPGSRVVVERDHLFMMKGIEAGRGALRQLRFAFRNCAAAPSLTELHRT